MRRLYYAAMAFITILRGKNHIYCDDSVKSVVGTRSSFMAFSEELTNMVDEQTGHKNIVQRKEDAVASR